MATYGIQYNPATYTVLIDGQRAGAPTFGTLDEALAFCDHHRAMEAGAAERDPRDPLYYNYHAQEGGYDEGGEG